MSLNVNPQVEWAKNRDDGGMASAWVIGFCCLFHTPTSFCKKFGFDIEEFNQMLSEIKKIR